MVLILLSELIHLLLHLLCFLLLNLNFIALLLILNWLRILLFLTLSSVIDCLLIVFLIFCLRIGNIYIRFFFLIIIRCLIFIEHEFEPILLFLSLLIQLLLYFMHLNQNTLIFRQLIRLIQIVKTKLYIRRIPVYILQKSLCFL